MKDRTTLLLLGPPPLVNPKTGIADWSLRHALMRHVEQVMGYCDGNVKWAASEMGVDASTLYRWVTGKSQPYTPINQRVAA